MPGNSTLIFPILTVTAVALSAGLLFAYAVSVNPGLGGTTDEVYLNAMQSINKAIQNPVFFVTYFSPAVLLPLSCWQAYKTAPAAGFRLIVLSSFLYIFGVIVVTIAGNVPLNDALAAVQIKGASAEALRRQRALFEVPWNRWHAVRTGAAALSLVLLLVALIGYPAGRAAPAAGALRP